MLQWFKRMLRPPVLWLSNRFSSNPDRTKVFKALGDLYTAIVVKKDAKKGPFIPIDPAVDRIILLSDQHKGTRNGSDDFKNNEALYLEALAFYWREGYTLISLGDSEELWENNILRVVATNKRVQTAEANFIPSGRLIKLYGNHDNLYHFDPLAPLYLTQMYGKSLPVHAGVVLEVQIAGQQPLQVFCTHGHQGDESSDGNAFSAWFVAHIWAPLQSFLDLNPNDPSNSNELKTLHNQMMYEWSALASNLLLITGHTHQPVFNSHTHLERLYIRLSEAQSSGDAKTIEEIMAEIPKRKQQYDHVNKGFEHMKPSYFNTGCCCYANGHLTGIELADGEIRLVKWSEPQGVAHRQVLEKSLLQDLAKAITPASA